MEMPLGARAASDVSGGDVRWERPRRGCARPTDRQSVAVRRRRTSRSRHDIRTNHLHRSGACDRRLSSQPARSGVEWTVLWSGRTASFLRLYRLSPTCGLWQHRRYQRSEPPKDRFLYPEQQVWHACNSRFVDGLPATLSMFVTPTTSLDS